MASRSISRRTFLHLGAASSAAAVLAACGQSAPAGEAAAGEAAAPVVSGSGGYQEAPMLSELVSAGTLPPVDQRLPDNPLVVTPLDSVGTYGGTWHTGSIERNGNDLIRNIGYEQLMRYTTDYSAVIPNIAESVEANEDGTEYIFNLRSGVKWSDGSPFTADDVVFWYEDVIMNREITPTTPTIPFTVTKIDDHTVSWTFETPNGLFLKDVARVNNERACGHPKAHLSQYHARYNEENLDELVAEHEMNTWADLFNFMREPHNNPDIPTMWPWKLEAGFGTGLTSVGATRNPYYIKVDTDNNQLPYIDEYVLELATDNEVLVLMALNGELDWQEQWINAPRNKSVFFDSQEEGDYRLFELTPTTVNVLNIMFNMNCTDSVIQEIARNRDFRIGLSHAIDRQQLIDVVFLSQGTPAQTSPRPESKYYHEGLATQYLEYDLDTANEYLDAAFPEKDNQGYRLGPDGNRISLIFEIDAGRTTYIDCLELIKPTWDEVGIEMNVRTMDRALWEERVRGTSFDYHASAHIFGGGAGDAVILDPRYWFPQNTGSSFWAKAWAHWYVDPDSQLAEEPPDDVKQQMELYREIRATSDEAKQEELLAEILDLQADIFPVIGVAYEGNLYGIANNRLKNTPDVLPSSWDYPTPAASNTNTYYFV